jgi:hypothetical protein
MLKAIHAQDSQAAAGQKARAIMEDLRAGKIAPWRPYRLQPKARWHNLPSGL